MIVPPDFTVAADTPEYAVGALGGIVIQVYREATPLEAAEIATRVAAEVVAADLRPRGLLIITQPGARAPDGEARQLLAHLGTRMKGAGACAFVAPGSGFGPATMRSVMTGMVMLARPDFPVRIFSETGAASDWLSRELGVRSDRRLAAALHALGVELPTA